MVEVLDILKYFKLGLDLIIKMKFPNFSNINLLMCFHIITRTRNFTSSLNILSSIFHPSSMHWHVLTLWSPICLKETNNYLKFLRNFELNGVI